jgi:hypothetical protein
MRQPFITPALSQPSRAASRERAALLAATIGMALRALFQLPARALLALIWVYQRAVSPALIVLFPTCGCRFSPTCSHYAAEAIRTRGIFTGVALALTRLVKCTPLHPGGFDPVPPSRFRCTRTAAPGPLSPRISSL